MKVISLIPTNGRYLVTVKDDEGNIHQTYSFRDYDDQLKIMINHVKYELIDLTYLQKARL